jgi:leucyl aminopeptidase
MQVTILSEKISRIQSELLVIGFFEDVRPLTGYAGEIDWYTNGNISSLIRNGKIRGGWGEVTLLATTRIATPKILLIGLGQKRDFSVTLIQQLSMHVLEIVARLKQKDVAVELWGQELCSLDLVSSLDSFLRGCPASHSNSNTADEVPAMITLLTNHFERINELKLRLREIDRNRVEQAPPGGLAQESGMLRARTQR